MSRASVKAANGNQLEGAHAEGGKGLSIQDAMPQGNHDSWRASLRTGRPVA